MINAANRSIFQTLFIKILTHTLILFQGMMIARMLGPDGKGLQAAILASAGLFIILFDLGLSNAINYFYATRIISIDKIQKIIKIIVFVQLVLCFLLYLAFQFEFSKEIVLPVERQILFFYIYLCFSVFLENQFRLIYSFLSSTLKFNSINFIDLISTLLKFTGYAYLYFFKRDFSTIVSILILDLAVNVLCFVVAQYFFRATVRAEKISALNETVRNVKFSSADHLQNSKSTQLKYILSYSAPIFLSNIVIYLNSKLDYWAIQNKLGFENLGYYSVASSGAQLMTIVPLSIGLVTLSYLNNLKPDLKINFFTKYARLNFSVMFAIGLCAFLIAPYIITLLFGDSFKNSIWLFQIMLITSLLYSHNFMLGIFLQSVAQNHIRFKADLFSLIINIGCIFFVVDRFGLQGAALFSLALQILSVGLIYFLLARKKIKFKQIYLVSWTDIKEFINAYKK